MLDPNVYLDRPSTTWYKDNPAIQHIGTPSSHWWPSLKQKGKGIRGQLFRGCVGDRDKVKGSTSDTRDGVDDPSVSGLCDGQLHLEESGPVPPGDRGTLMHGLPPPFRGTYEAGKVGCLQLSKGLVLCVSPLPLACHLTLWHEIKHMMDE